MADKVNTTGIRVFVYGSLKNGRGNAHFLEDADFLGRCMIEGKHRLINLGYYPGLVRVPDDSAPMRVLGEVYRVSKDTLDALDMLEGHPDYYARHKVETPWKGAWCYYLPDAYIEHAPLVETVDDNVQVWRPSDEEREYVASSG